MATLAEQNAVRCKEAGNVLYKSERYEEVSEQNIRARMRVFFCVFAFFFFAFFIFLFLLRLMLFSKMRKARARL